MNMEYRSMCAKLHFIWKWWDRRDDSYGAYAFGCICCAVRLRQCHCEAIIKWSHCRKWIATWFPWHTAAFVNFFLLFFHFVLCHCVCVCGIITSSATFYFCLYLFWHFGLCLRFALFFFSGISSDDHICIKWHDNIFASLFCCDIWTILLLIAVVNNVDGSVCLPHM